MQVFIFAGYPSIVYSTDRHAFRVQEDSSPNEKTITPGYPHLPERPIARVYIEFLLLLCFLHAVGLGPPIW